MMSFLINEDVKSMTKYFTTCTAAHVSVEIFQFSQMFCWDFQFCCRVWLWFVYSIFRVFPWKQIQRALFKRMRGQNNCGFKVNGVSIKCLMQPISNMSGGVLGRSIVLKPYFLYWLNLIIFSIQFRLFICIW